MKLFIFFLFAVQTLAFGEDLSLSNAFFPKKPSVGPVQFGNLNTDPTSLPKIDPTPNPPANGNSQASSPQ